MWKTVQIAYLIFSRMTKATSIILFNYFGSTKKHKLTVPKINEKKNVISKRILKEKIRDFFKT